MRIFTPGRANRGPSYRVEDRWLRSLPDASLNRVPGPQAAAERMRRHALRETARAAGHSAPIGFVRWLRRFRKDANPERYWWWRETVLCRQGWRCKLCGVHGVPLDAHHVIPWAHGTRHRYDPSNGWALCKRCHAQVESGRYFVADLSEVIVTLPAPVLVRHGEGEPTERLGCTVSENVPPRAMSTSEEAAVVQPGVRAPMPFEFPLQHTQRR